MGERARFGVEVEEEEGGLGRVGSPYSVAISVTRGEKSV